MGVSFFKACLEICCCRKKRQQDEEAAVSAPGGADTESNGAAGSTPSAVPSNSGSAVKPRPQQRQPRVGSRRAPPTETVIELSEFGEDGAQGGGGLAMDAVDRGNDRPGFSPQLASPEMLDRPRTPSEIEAGENSSNLGALMIQKVPAVAEVEEPIALAGRLLVEFTYIPGAEKLNVLIIRADNVPEKERGGSTSIMIHLTILPSKKQRFKTKLVPSSKGVFNERFQFVHVTPDIIEDCTLRMRLYGKERFSKRVIGEINIPMKDLDFTSPLCDEPRWKTLLPKGIVLKESREELEETVSLGSLAPVEVPELLVSLHYADQTGRLSVLIVKGANFKTSNMMLSPDTFVKVRVVSGKGKRIGRSLTTLRIKMSDPEFNETFVYPMSPVDLVEATLMISVYAKRKGCRKPMLIGWIAMGKTPSSDSCNSHWKEMMERPDRDIDHWHKLMSV